PVSHPLGKVCPTPRSSPTPRAQAFEQPGRPRLRRPPLVAGRKCPRPPRAEDALFVRVAPLRGVALRRDQHVRAHRVELAAAERAAIRRRLEALRATHAPPARLRFARHWSERYGAASRGGAQATQASTIASRRSGSETASSSISTAA